MVGVAIHNVRLGVVEFVANDDANYRADGANKYAPKAKHIAMIQHTAQRTTYEASHNDTDPNVGFKFHDLCRSEAP